MFLLPSFPSFPPFSLQKLYLDFWGTGFENLLFLFCITAVTHTCCPPKYLERNWIWACYVVATGSWSLNFKCQKEEKECYPYCSLTQGQTDKMILLFLSSFYCGWSRSLASKCFWHYMFQTLLLLVRCLLQFYFHPFSFHPQITHNIQGHNWEMPDIN